MNKRQREKLFKEGNCFKVISKYPQRHHFPSGEIVRSVSKWGEEHKRNHYLFHNGFFEQVLHISQVRPIYSKKRPTKDCSPS